jgi:uncharacterized protein YqjF (DUF2071 family)
MVQRQERTVRIPLDGAISSPLTALRSVPVTVSGSMASARTILETTTHRPWPLPSRPWVMFQSWRNLMFAHWSVPRATLRLLVPAQLEIDLFEGRAWVALTPFRVVGLRSRFLPALPRVSTFPELNLRTYVRFDDRPGVYFFTLEATSLPAILAARMLYRLPYRRAEMTLEHDGDWIRYRSRRVDSFAEFAARYRPLGEVFQPVEGTLEHFLTERYALYTVDDRRNVMRGDVHHAPWDLQRAEAEIERNTIAAAHGLPRAAARPVLHYSERQDTLIWLPVRAG